MKGVLPFRIGTTSYILPDDIIPNLLHLRERVDDVELVLFESEEFSNLPSVESAAEIERLGAEADLSYTVHLPLDIALGAADEDVRRESVHKCLRVVERMSSVHPFAWILHLHGDQRGEPPTDDMPRWLAQNRRSLSEFLQLGPPSRRVCIEIQDYDFQHFAALVREFDLSVCVDIEA